MERLEQRAANLDSPRVRALRVWDRIAAQLQPIPIPALVLDTSGCVVCATRDLPGWPAAVLEGAGLDEIVVADQRMRIQDAIATVAEHARSTVIDIAIPPRGATLVTPDFGAHVRLALSPLRDLDDGISAVLALVHDITAFRGEESRLRRRERLFVDTQGVAHFGVWEWDPAEPTATWSDDLYRIYGLDPGTHVPSYEDYLRRVHPEDRARVIAATDAVFQHHVPYSHDERIIRDDGEIRYLHTWAEPVLDASGKLLRLIGVCQDITQLRLAENERDQLRDQRVEHARRALQLRDEFIAVAAHELRTPLTPLKGHLQILERSVARASGGAPHLVRVVEAALRQVERVDELVDLLLDVSTMRWGQLELEREACDLGDVVRTVVAAMAHQIRGAGCEVRLDLAGGVEGSWDRVRLAQVIRNLLSNAVKFGRDRPVVVSLTRTAQSARLAIHNEGPHIPPDALERIFEPFERAAPVANYPGLGLGLYVAREVVRAHGGSIAVESDPPPGTTFVVELPCEATQPARSA